MPATRSPLCIGLFLIFLSTSLFRACHKKSTNILTDDDPCVIDQSRDRNSGDDFSRAGSSANPTAFFELIQPSNENQLTGATNQFRLEGCVYSRAPIQVAQLVISGKYPSSLPSHVINLINGPLGQVVPQNTPRMVHFRVLVTTLLF